MLFRCHSYFIIYLCSISFIFSIQIQNSQLQNILKQLMAHKQNPSLSCLSQTLVFHLGNRSHAGLSQERSRCPRRAGNTPSPTGARTGAGIGQETWPTEPMEQHWGRAEQEATGQFWAASARQPTPRQCSQARPWQWWFQQLRKLSQPHLCSAFRLQALDTGERGCKIKFCFPSKAGDTVDGVQGTTLRGFNPPTDKMLLSTKAPQSFPK